MGLVHTNMNNWIPMVPFGSLNVMRVETFTKLMVVIFIIFQYLSSKCKILKRRLVGKKSFSLVNISTLRLTRKSVSFRNLVFIIDITEIHRDI